MEYYEEQKFTQWWIKLIIGIIGLPITVLLAYGVIKQLIFGIPFGNNPLGNVVLLISFVFVTICLVWIYKFFQNAILVTRIDRYRIEYRFYPFNTKSKIVLWSDVETFEIRKYNPILIYQGSGQR